jgi:2-polyprenyl-3-methyl-5-hydroxy-6-metoxy-1,4-benzoquinol methylase
MSMAVLVLILCIGLMVIFAVFLAWSWIFKTPFYPSSARELSALKQEIPQLFAENQKFMDVGSGDGRIVKWAALNGMKAYGIEYNPFLSLFSRVFTLNLSSKRKIYNTNYLKHNFSEYNIIYLYLFPEHINQISQKLFEELKPGSIIITNTFKISDTPADYELGKLNVYKITKK